MEVAAISIAVLSLVVAALALGWQIAAWRFEGPRLRLTLQHGLYGHGGVVTDAVNRSRKLRDMSSLREQGWDGPELVAVEVTNHGRSRAKVARYAIRLKRGGTSVEYPQALLGSPELPHWLEPGESATWYAELRDAVALVQATRASLRRDAGGVFMTVETGTGRRLRTRRYLDL